MDEEEAVFYLLQQPLLLLALALMGGIYALEHWAHGRRRELALRLGVPLGRVVRELGVSANALGGEHTRDIDETGLRIVLLSPSRWLIYTEDDERRSIAFCVLETEAQGAALRMTARRYAMCRPWAGLAGVCAVFMWLPGFSWAPKLALAAAAGALGAAFIALRLRADLRRIHAYVEQLAEARARAAR